MVIHISKHNSHSCWMELFQMQDMILFQELLDTGNKFSPSAVVIFASFNLKMKN